MEEYEYAVVLEFDDEIGEYVALVPALPGCTSQGKTKEEALANVREAIRGHIETLRQLGHGKMCGICTTKVEQASRLFGAFVAQSGRLGYRWLHEGGIAVGSDLLLSV
ncbi:MAG TPA: type II toxin-antitoxin system HicB family antitoxin [Dehalococcoidia bacterium]|nr:type II toxin-antitoxin system HicB family antitoxin [Dehalococcoidia bacterium]